MVVSELVQGSRSWLHHDAAGKVSSSVVGAVEEEVVESSSSSGEGSMLHWSSTGVG